MVTNKRPTRKQIALVSVIFILITSLIIVLSLTLRYRKGQGSEVTVDQLEPKFHQNKPKVHQYKPIVPIFDKREYRVIELNNSMKFTLVYDKAAKKAQACFTVAVGSFSDPDDVLGLAHFLEHMLFQGSEKYPERVKAMSFAVANGGSANANTESMNTNYYFQEVSNDGLRKLSDMFAQQFFKPLFKKDGLLGEIKAVQSEYELKKVNFAEKSIKKTVSNPLSPYHRFAIGNNVTLDRIDIAERVKQFYYKYYSANLMTAAIVANEPLDTLQNLAEELFTQIPNKNIDKPGIKILPFPNDDKRYISRRIYHNAGWNELLLMFPINIRGFPDLDYVSYILNYRGEGSLTQYLLKRNYISEEYSFSASLDYESSFEAFKIFEITVYLTDKGLQNPNFVITALFKFLKRAKESGNNKALWQQMKKEHEIDFDYPSGALVDSNYAKRLSISMREQEDPRDYLYPPSRHIYNESKESEYLKLLNPDNFNILIPYGNSAFQLNQTNEFYDVSYLSQPISQDEIDNWDNVKIDDELTLPEPNNLIPDDFTIVSKEGAISYPVLIDSVSDIDLWWYQDTKYNDPRTYMSFKIYSQHKESSTLKQKMILNLLVGMIQSYSSDYYDTRYSYFNDKYLSLRIEGFSDTSKVENITATATDNLFGVNFRHGKEFDDIIQSEITEYEAYGIMEMDSTDYYKLLVNKNKITHQVAEENLIKITDKDVEFFLKNYLKKVAIECFVIGNVNSDQAVTYSSIVKKKFLKHASVVNKNKIKINNQTSIYKIPEDKLLIIRKEHEGQNSMARAIFQIGPTKSNGPFKNRIEYTIYVLSKLLTNMMTIPALNYLRIQEHLGYHASCYLRDYESILSFEIFVISELKHVTPEHMASKIDDFIIVQYKTFNDSRNTLEGIKNWKTNKDGLKSTLESPHIKFEDKAEELLNEINSPLEAFNKKQKMIAALDQLTMDDFLKFYELYLMGKQRRKVYIQMYGAHQTLSKSVGEQIGEVLIEDIKTYRDKHLKEFFELGE